MTASVPAGEQLVAELYTRSVSQSLSFFLQLGFELVREERDFAELHPDAAPAFSAQFGNIRVLVPNVDAYRARAQQLGLTVLRPIGDRSYGLRDFTIAGPDGLGLRFAPIAHVKVLSADITGTWTHSSTNPRASVQSG
jgi:hypothetical protein